MILYALAERVDKTKLQNVALHGLIEFGLGIAAIHTLELLPCLWLRVLDEADKRIEVNGLLLIVGSLITLRVTAFGDEITLYICFKVVFL